VSDVYLFTHPFVINRNRLAQNRR